YLQEVSGHPTLLGSLTYHHNCEFWQGFQGNFLGRRETCSSTGALSPSLFFSLFHHCSPTSAASPDRKLRRYRYRITGLSQIIVARPAMDTTLVITYCTELSRPS